MSGKAYTMKEMKAIVDYLVEHKVYGEIKGRKMWIDFSNTKLTNRTWQSLKETFLKRILPDIHNPYYKLTMDQVRSFRQGFDVQSREENKLEIQKFDENSNSNAENLKNNEQPSTSKCIDEDKTSGEDIQSSRILARNRASVETVILDNCYETADDVLRDLEMSTDSSAHDEAAKSQNKSLRDLITYSEPLTPMLQEVLHDFATDEESDSGEPKMQIVEKEHEPEEQGNLSPSRIPDATEDGLEQNNEESDKRDENESDKFVEPKVKSLRLRKRQGIYVPVDDIKALQNAKTTNSDNNKSDTNATRVEVADGSGPSTTMLSDSNEKGVDKLTKSHAQSTQNCSNSTTDTVLPNNQEALHDKKLENKKNTNEIMVNESKVARNRAALNDKEIDLKLQKMNSNETTHNLISDANIDSQKTNCSDNIDIIDDIDENQNKKSDVTMENGKQTPENDTRDIFPPNKLPERDDKNTSAQSSQANPCLQSMSLYDEQFTMTNHTSDSSEHEPNNLDQPKQISNDKPTTVTGNKIESKIKEVVMLKSHSDTDSDAEKVPAKKNIKNVALSKSKRDNALANVFGFSSGAVSKRKKRTSLRKYSGSHNYHGNGSSYESSEWTSESDSDYVSPPRGHKNGRRARKYLKPKSARIHSLEEEGGLFVMYGKKLFPLVKDGRSVNNYLIYSPDSDPDEEENYWKQKYVEERKRVEELKKIVLRCKRDEPREPSPLLPTKSSRPRTAPRNRRSTSQIVLSSDNEKDVVPKEKNEKKEPLVTEPKNKTLKITFAKNNQEVHLEGHWSQLHPVLADVVEIFHKDTDVPIQSNTGKCEKKQSLEIARQKSPIILTPVDEEVHDKVNELEKEIFKEIEEKDHEEQAETKNQTENNVTKRKRVNRMSSTSTEASNSSKKSASPNRSNKRAKITKETEEEKNEKDTIDKDSNKQVEIAVETIEKGIETPLIDTNESKASVTPVKKRTPRKEAKPKESVKSVATKKSKSTTRRSNLVISKEENNFEGDDDSEIRYMFPPTKKSASKLSTSVGKTKR